MKVAVICEAGSENGKAACDALVSAGHDAECVALGESMVADLRSMRPDVAFNAAGEMIAQSSLIQDVLAALEIPFVGASAQACRRASDAALLTGVMESYWAVAGADLCASWPLGVVVSCDAFQKWGMADALDLLEDRIPGGYPLCVKPTCGGGARKVNSAQELKDALSAVFGDSQEALVQQWIDGVRMEVCIIGSGWDAYPLPPVERAIDPESGAEALVAPVRLASLSSNEEDAQAIRAEIERAALEAYWAFNMQDCASVDMIWDGGQPRVIKVRPYIQTPEGSFFHTACAAAGLSVSAVMNELVDVYA